MDGKLLAPIGWVVSNYLKNGGRTNPCTQLVMRKVAGCLILRYYNQTIEFYFDGSWCGNIPDDRHVTPHQPHSTGDHIFHSPVYIPWFANRIVSSSVPLIMSPVMSSLLSVAFFAALLLFLFCYVRSEWLGPPLNKLRLYFNSCQSAEKLQALIAPLDKGLRG